MPTTPTRRPFLVERTMLGGTQVQIRCGDRFADIQGATIQTRAGLVELDRDELYRLADIVAVADPEQWARRFPCPHDPEGA
jgi:hypothetical protein